MFSLVLIMRIKMRRVFQDRIEIVGKRMATRGVMLSWNPMDQTGATNLARCVRFSSFISSIIPLFVSLNSFLIQKALVSFLYSKISGK